MDVEPTQLLKVHDAATLRWLRSNPLGDITSPDVKAMVIVRYPHVVRWPLVADQPAP